MKKLLFPIIFLLGFYCLPFGLSAQKPTVKVNPYNPQQQFEVPKLQEDFVIFQKTLEEVHPNLYRYCNKTQFDTLFAQTYRELTQPLTEWAYYRVLAKLIATIQDGHTSITDSQESDYYTSKLLKIFPFFIKIIDNQVYIMLNGSNETDIRTGSQLKSINGRNMQEILTKIYPYLSVDGEVKTRKNWLISQNFMFYYAQFIDTNPQFSLHLTDILTGKDIITSVEALPLPQIIRNVRSNVKNQRAMRYFRQEFWKELAPLDLDFRDESKTAILSIGSFMADNYEKFLKNSFELIRIKKAQNLVVDVRDNNGGHMAFAETLYSYLTAEAFRSTDSLRFFSGKITYVQHTNLRRLSTENLSNLQTKLAEISQKEQTKTEEKTYKPAKNHFGGKVYFLMNGGTFSAANHFICLAHHLKRGTFLGEESGGNYYESTGNFGLNFIRLTLPNSKIRVNIPTIRFKFAVSDYPHPTRGLLPDITLSPNIRDIMGGADTELEDVLEMISQGKVEK